MYDTQQQLLHAVGEVERVSFYFTFRETLTQVVGAMLSGHPTYLLSHAQLPRLSQGDAKAGAPLPTSTN